MAKRDAWIKETTAQKASDAQKASETLPCASVGRSLGTQRQKGPGAYLMEHTALREKLQGGW